MPTLRQLEYLVALADTRHFRRAAERSNTTQPTLSEQIKALEERLGVDLVERSRQGVMLTPAGDATQQIARRMLRDLSEIRGIAALGSASLKGVMRVGVPSTLGPYLLPLIVPTLHRAHPELKLYVREELPQSLPRSLAEGSYDFIITPMPIRGDELTITELFREPLFLTVAADSPLAAKERIERSDLEGQQVLTLGPGHHLHDVVIALCQDIGAHVRLDYEGTSLDMVREMVLTGLGITFMPGLYVRRELASDADLKVLRIHGRAVYRTIGMAWRSSSPRQKQLQELADLSRTALQPALTELTKLA